MATELGVAYISLLPEMRSFRSNAEKGMDRVGKGVATRFGVGFNGAIGSIVSRSAGIFAAGFASIKVGGFLKDAISQASDLGETTSKVGQIFGPAAKDIVAFSKTSATALGQTQQAALDANATFGIFGKSAGLQGKDLTGFTTRLTTLAGDLASFNNTSPEQAIEAIGAALRGETEPIRAYGVLLDDASLRQEALSQGLIKTTKQALTPQQKVLAAQALILKQTTTAQGDFARTSGGLANQQRILSAQFSNFKTSIGAIALPLVTKLFGFLNDRAIPAVTGLFKLFAKGDFSGELRKAFGVEEDSKFVTFLLTVRNTAASAFKEIRGGLIAFGSAFKANDGDITSSGLPGFMERLGFLAAQAFGVFKSEVLPRLKDFAGFIKGNAVPSVQNLITAFTPLARDVGSAVVSVFQKLGPAIAALAAPVAALLPALKSFTGFLRDNQTLVGAIAVGVGAMVVAFKAYQGAMVLVSIATKAWAAVQAVLNVVLNANPIGIIVLAIVGLVAALVYAYKNSETFRNIVNGVFNAVKNTAQTVFSAVVGFVKGAISWVKANWPLLLGILTGPFGLAVVLIAKHWTAIKTAAQSALRFVVGKVLDFAQDIINGAAKAFGWVPGLGDKLKGASTEFAKFRDSVNAKLGGITDQSINFSIKYSSTGVNLSTPSSVGRRATGGPGGPVRGPGTTTNDRAGLYALSNREWVIRAKASQKYGDYAMAAVNAGRATIIPDGGFAAGGRPGLNLNSSFPDASSISSGASKFITASATAAAKAILKSGVARLGSALQFAREQVGKPYIWGGVGPAGYDCSGFLSALVNVAQGRSPYSRRFATGGMPGGVFQRGPGAFSVAWFRGNPGHTAGTLLGQNVESRGGVGPIVGPGARGASNSLFNSGIYHLPGFARGGKVGDGPFDLLNPRGKYYLGDDIRKEILPKALSFDSGGLLPTGYSFVHNGTGSPEPVGHDVLRKGDLDGMRIVIDAGSVGTLTGHIAGTADARIAVHDKQVKRRVYQGVRQ